MAARTRTLVPLLAALLLGCGRSGHSAGGGAHGLEGTYVDPDSPDISLTLEDGRYRQGASDIHAAGTYTIRPLDEKTFELDVVHTGDHTGTKSTLVLRKDGDALYVRDKEGTVETRFERK